MDLIGNIAAILIVVLAFGFIIFVHELGHFIAARWAHVRVLAFALGFGPALVSYRKGLGWRRGSSEPEHARILAEQKQKGVALSPSRAAGISPTEYRLNAIPFGGYVKMLGQVDGDPTQVSDEPDGYQRCPIWKRMVIMGAGVTMNILLACVLFVAVFMVGLRTEPATIGSVAPGSPASRAQCLDAGPIGLRAGDRIVSIAGRAPNHFNDVTMGVAMTRRGSFVQLVVDRPGVGLLKYEAAPETGTQSKLMEIGIAPPASARIASLADATERASFDRYVREIGAPGLEPGMRLVRAGAITTIAGEWALEDAANASGGKPFEAEFEAASGKRITLLLTPRALLQTSFVPLDGDSTGALEHLLGLTPVLSVAPTEDASQARQGLRDGDIFARLGSLEYPSIASGITEIHRHKGKPIEVNVLRAGAEGTRSIVRLDPAPNVKNEGLGQIGFLPEDSRNAGTWVALPPKLILDRASSSVEAGAMPSAASVITSPGSRIVAINGTRVENFTQLREVLKDATRAALQAGTPAEVTLTLIPPGNSSQESAPSETQARWTIAPSDLKALHALGWASPIPQWLFEQETFLDRATTPGAAITRGLSETRRVMAMTYLTFARLLDGTVKVEHLKGPVGIAHIGTKVVSKGAIWLLFYMALISVNLAVLNFLPLPITDGGQFIFLVIEMVRGRPAPVALQNIATFVGLLLIGTMFVVVTYHDLLNLF
jgi:regulator of sigma E protease